MYVHHLVTLFLVGHSYMMQRTQDGVIVMLLHNISDVPTSFVRGLIQTRYMAATVGIGVFMMLSWAYTRLYLFPQVIYQGYQKQFLAKGGFYSEPYLTYELLILLILHTYWYYLFIAAFAKLIYGGKLEDNQQSIKEDSDETKEE